MRRLLCAVVRPLRRLTRPLRLRLIEYRMDQSRDEIERLYNMRDYHHRLVQNEHFNLVRLDKRRQEIVKWEL